MGPSATSAESVGPIPTQLPQEQQLDVKKFRNTDEGRKFVAWVRSEHDKAKTARKPKELQWYVNMSMALGNQWVRPLAGNAPLGLDEKLVRQRAPRYQRRRSVNLTRSYVRWALSKLTSNEPEIQAVPGTGDDQDVRGAYVAQAAWESVSSTQHLRREFNKTAWWDILTGNGFTKTSWDTKACNGLGDIRFNSVTPFHVYVPDLREQEIEDQPYIINAYTKTVQWMETFWADELGGVKLAPTSRSDELIQGAYLNLQQQKNPDSVILYEMWLKPGAHPMMPNGGLAIIVEDTLLALYPDGMPYQHGQYPITHFRFLETGGFYADSPLNDLNQLQREYNELRTDIGEAARKMARPQLIAPQGSIVPSKITNEPGLVIQYKQGFAPPMPMQMPQLPTYMLEQQDRIKQDWDEIAGTSDLATGNAPPGVSAGTAISYLTETANSYFTPQFQDIEAGYEKIAKQTIGLFVQYVDLPRKIKTVGADGAFDTLELSGMDLANGTDLRVEANSSAPNSQAATRAFAMDLFSIQAIDQPTLMKMLDVNGFQRVMDDIQVAERKAQRENTKMKQLSPIELQLAQMQQMQQMQQAAQQNPQLAADPEFQQTMEQGGQPPVMVPVDDFDNHQVHIQVHNVFRQGEEYETLDQSVKDQFAIHVAWHQRMAQQQQMQQMLSTIPSDGSDSESGGQDGPQGPPPSGPAPDTGPGGPSGPDAGPSMPPSGPAAGPEGPGGP
jgi:hypothetical protein